MNRNQPVVASNQDLATMPLEEALNAYAPNFAAVLPSHIKLEAFKRIVISAINTNPELRYADRRSLFNSCVKCASDGLLPDGREAALTVFRTKIKDRSGTERYADLCIYMPMVAGIRKRLRNSGEVLSATAEIVHRNDKFSYRLGDEPMIEHEPTALDAEPGDEIGAYAIIRLKNGEILRDVMSRREIERSRAQSRAPNSLMWSKFWGEGARKTVLRRCAKAAPSASMLERLLARDEEISDLPPIEDLPPVPPRPRLADYQSQPEPEPEPEPDDGWTLVTPDGEFVEFANPIAAADELAEMARMAPGRAALEALWNDNQAFIEALAALNPTAHRLLLGAFAPVGNQAPDVRPTEAPPPALSQKGRRQRRKAEAEEEAEPAPAPPPADDPDELPDEEPPGLSQDGGAGMRGSATQLPPVSVLVPFNPSGTIQAWFGEARTTLRAMKASEEGPDRFAAFRKANYAPLLRLQKELHGWWLQMDEEITAGESVGQPR